MSKQRYLDSGHNWVTKLLHGGYRFETRAQASKMLGQLRERYIVNDQLMADEKSAANETLVLWVQGFDVTEEELSKGRVGNYALIRIEEADGMLYLAVTKVVTELSLHPELPEASQQPESFGAVQQSKPPDSSQQTEPSDATQQSEPRQRMYLNTNNNLVRKLLSGTYRYNTYDSACEMLKTIRENFVVSKKLVAYEDAEDPGQLIVWIRGFELTEDERNKGYVGNYVHVRITQEADHKFHISLRKMVTELSDHPQRRRPPSPMPDWGHPILRDVKKGRQYVDREEAERELSRLVHAFPDISRTEGPDRLRIMIWNSVTKKPMKFILEVVDGNDGRFKISEREVVQWKGTRSFGDAEPNWNKVDEAYDEAMYWQ